MIFIYVWLVAQLILESWPVSSSGHLMLLERGWSYFCSCIVWPSLEVKEVWYVLIQIPTIVIVSLFFLSRWWFIVRHLPRCWRIIFPLIGYVFVADCMTAVWYLIIKKYQLCTIPLWCGFALTGLTLYALRWIPEGRKSCTLQKAIILGCVQGIALLPGLSRLACTFVAARVMGISSRRSFELSWIIELPLISAAAFVGCIEYYMHPTVQILSPQIVFAILMGSIGAWYSLHIVHILIMQRRISNLCWYMILPMMLAILM